MICHWHPEQALESQFFDYDIRGRLQGMNRAYLTASDTASHYFGYETVYENTTAYGTLPGYAKGLYNGNISGVTWRGQRGGGAVSRYQFDYDPAGQLLKAGFGRLSGGSFSNSTVNYDVRIGDGNNTTSAYDANGNIRKLSRYGYVPSTGSSILADSLLYSYKTGSNRLAGVSDYITGTEPYGLGDFKNGSNSGDDYLYDSTGSIIQDGNKGISSVIYNVLGLPEEITVAGKGSIRYRYTAMGERISRRVEQGGTITTTDYLYSMVLRNDSLLFKGIAGGRLRISSSGNTLAADYYLTDYLGNVRVVITDEAGMEGKVLEENHYYPFGLRMQGISYAWSSSSAENAYKFNAGSELITDFDIDLYETAYRNLDVQTGRFWQTDPMAGAYYSMTPYQFGFNNPLLYNDPTGAITWQQINDIWNSDYGGHWDKSMGDAGKPHLWGMDDPNAWFTGASTLSANDLFGKYGFIGSWKEGQRAFYGWSSSSLNDLVTWSGMSAHVSELEEPLLIKGVIRSNLFESREYIYPDSWGGSERWNGGLQSNGGTDDNGGFSPWGPTLIGLGQPLDFLKPVGAAGSQPGSSIVCQKYFLKEVLG